MLCYRILQFGTCIIGFVLFMYGILTLPQPTVAPLQKQQTAQEVQEAYSSTVLHSTQFILLMTGIGVFVAGILCIGLCRSQEVQPSAPASAELMTQP